MNKIKLGEGKYLVKVARDNDTKDIGIAFVKFDNSHKIGSKPTEEEDKKEPSFFISLGNINSATIMLQVLTYSIALINGVSETDWSEHIDFERVNGRA
jgi:hypothetical protein